MTKPFDPHKPFTTRDGQKMTLVAILQKKTPLGDSLVVQGENGQIYLRLGNGQLNSVAGDPRDLVNIPERVEIEAWAVVDVPPGRVVPQVYWLQAIAEDFQRRYGGIIVRLTGSYER